MNRVITINLNGNAYQLEESGYETLRVYLDNAARRLEGNPDRDEIMADIEQAIADKFRAVLGANKTVVITKEVESVLVEMGPVQDPSEAAEARPSENSETRKEGRAEASTGSGSTGNESGAAKRLYAIKEGAMLAGVCNGLAAYFNVDVTFIRIAFVVLTFFWGSGILVYLVMALIIPTANTSAEKAAAHGAAATAQEFIRRARAGYYEGMKTFHDKHARREWKRKFKQQMRGWQQGSQYYQQANAYRWTPAAHPNFGPGAPLFWLLNVLITVAGVYAIYSLVTSGAAFGVNLPAGVPLWIGILGVVVLWNVVAWPVKILAWGASAEFGRHHRLTGPCGAFGDFLVGLCFLVLIVWLADRYVPQFHEVLKQLPPLLHQAVDSVQKWLERH